MPNVECFYIDKTSSFLVCGVLPGMNSLRVAYKYSINATTDAANGGWILNFLSTNYTRSKFTFAQNE